MLFVAKLHEVQGIYPQHDHDLACHPSFSDNNGLYLNRHHQGSLCTMGRVQQLRGTEDDTIYRTFR